MPLHRDRSQLDRKPESPNHASLNHAPAIHVRAKHARAQHADAQHADANDAHENGSHANHGQPSDARSLDGSARHARSIRASFVRGFSRRALLATTALAALALGARADEKVPVTWQGKHFTSKELPDKLGEGPRAAVQLWEAWAKKSHYRMDFDNDARVLLVTPEKSSRAEAHLKIIARAESWFDALLPAPDRAPIKGLEKPAAAKPAAAAAPAPTPAPDVIPEDPEGPPPGTSVSPAKTSPTGTSAPVQSAGASWGSGSIEPDKQTAVVLVLDNEKDYASVIEMLGSTQSYLKDWVGDAKKALGFVLEQPLSGAYVENASGQEEWNPDHELLNRTAQLLCLRRFGQQPNWIVQGLAWEAEMAYDGALYCFPYRSEFVGVGEHTAWPSDLRNQFKQRAEKTLKIDELAHWERGRWDANASKIAWGLVHYVAAQSPGKFSATLEEMRQFRDADDRKTKPDGTWERIPHYEISGEHQLAILKKHFGADVLANASNAFRKGDDAKKDEKKTAAK